MTQITLTTEQVRNIATQIENDNTKLKDLLDDSKTTIDSLSAYWTGDAASETQQAYESFAKKYFQQYYEILHAYVKFLNANVADHYDETETIDKQLADAFR